MGHNMTFYKMALLPWLAALVAGCASTGNYAVTSAPRSPEVEYVAVDAETEPAAGIPVPDVLRLTDALALALRGNPELAASSYEVRAAEARVLQAGLLPNPEVELGVEEYDRGGEGLDSSEMAVGIEQKLELGGKRRLRKRAAEARGEVAGWDYEAKRLDILTETARRFTAVAVARERLGLARSAEDLAEKTSQAVAERVNAGKEPALQASKSEAELEMARMEALQAVSAVDVARKRLAAMWGAEQADFESVEGNLDTVPYAIPSLDALRLHLSRNPDLARWEAVLQLRRAALSSEKAARIPDLTGAVGYAQFEEDGSDALAFGIGMPLPVFDRNQGSIEAAAHELSKAQAERLATETTLAAELAVARAALMGSHQRVETLRGKVVPTMEQAFGAAREGYQQGKFGFLDMLDAQRGLFEAKGALVDALSDYHSALTDIQRITGTSIEELTAGK